MSWIIDKSINRISRTFKRIGNRQIFKEDIQALTELNECFEIYKMQRVTDNIIYSKILLLLIKERYFKLKNINNVLSSIEADLEFSLEHKLEVFSAMIKNQELYSYIETLTVDIPDNELSDIEALIKQENEFWTIHQKSIFEKITEFWNKDYISDCFYNSANSFLTDLKNYK